MTGRPAWWQSWMRTKHQPPGFTHAAQFGANTLFWGEGARPQMLTADGKLKLINAADWRALKAAEDKRRRRSASVIDWLRKTAEAGA